MTCVFEDYEEDFNTNVKMKRTEAYFFSWEIWKKQNACVFRHISAPVAVATTRIKEEAKVWSLDRAIFLGNVIPMSRSFHKILGLVLSI
jgi:hypothetical protein